MHASPETVLGVLPAASDKERVLLVLVHQASDSVGSHSSRMELRQQSFGVGIGWFTQSSVQLEPEQVADLRNALGMTTTVAPSRRPSLPREFSKVSARSWQPRVVHADAS
jgi:hypothetical protein